MSRLPFSSTLSPYTTLFRSSLYPSQPFPGAGSGRYHIRQISLCYRRCFKGPGDLGALQKHTAGPGRGKRLETGGSVCIDLQSGLKPGSFGKFSAFSKPDTPPAGIKSLQGKLKREKQMPLTL